MFKNKFKKSYDTFINDKLYDDGATYFDLAQDRVNLILKTIRENNIDKILDIGFYPGLIGRIIKDKFPNIIVYGTGKLNGENNNINFPWYDKIDESEFDPFYGQLLIPSYEEKFDLIIAAEIIEHLISPVEMLKFANKNLVNGGLFIVTTPNVSSFGAIARLIMGKSNYETLDNSVIFYKSDWRAHVRLYDKKELIELGKRFNFSFFSHSYYLSSMTLHEKKKNINWIIRLIASLIPMYREDQIIIYTNKIV